MLLSHGLGRRGVEGGGVVERLPREAEQTAVQHVDGVVGEVEREAATAQEALRWRRGPALRDLPTSTGDAATS